MGGPGVGYECLCKDGMHVNEDHYLAEIIDPDTLRPLPDGRGRGARLHDPHAGRRSR